MPLIHHLKMCGDDWKKWRSKCESYGWYWNRKGKKWKNYGTKAVAKKTENTTKILKYVFTTNSFRSAFAGAVAAVCIFVCGSSQWTATGTRVYVCIDSQNDNHARMMQIIHWREAKKLDIHLSNNLHISQSSFYNFAIAMANAVGAQLCFSAIIIITAVVIDIIMWSSSSSSSFSIHKLEYKEKRKEIAWTI